MKGNNIKILIELKEVVNDCIVGGEYMDLTVYGYLISKRRYVLGIIPFGHKLVVKTMAPYIKEPTNALEYNTNTRLNVVEDEIRFKLNKEKMLFEYAE